MTSLRFLLGMVLGVVGPLAAGEFYARYQPPADINLYLGDRSPLHGPFKPDPVLGADYRSFDDLRTDYSERLSEIDALRSARTSWLWFGNSFVQAPGMLGDIAQAALGDRRMIYLRRNEPFNIRAAQLRLFLQQGMRPERVIFVLLPIDTALSPWRPIASIRVTQSGAVTYQPRMPPRPFGALVDHSRLALLGWVRSGQQNADPSYRPAHAASTLSPYVIDDMTRVLGVVGSSARKHRVAVTVALLPNRNQILGREGFHWQDAAARIASENGLDVFDGRNVFDGVANKLDVFLPDNHFNASGNAIVLSALRRHLDGGARAAAGARP